MAETLNVTPEEVAVWVHLPLDKRPLLIDCREEDELAICQIPGNRWIPLQQIPRSLESIRSESERGVVVYCHHGMRSLSAVEFLRARGIDRAFTMSGGIDDWSRTIAPEVPRY